MSSPESASLSALRKIYDFAVSAVPIIRRVLRGIVLALTAVLALLALSAIIVLVILAFAGPETVGRSVIAVALWLAISSFAVYRVARIMRGLRDPDEFGRELVTLVDQAGVVDRGGELVATLGQNSSAKKWFSVVRSSVRLGMAGMRARDDVIDAPCIAPFFPRSLFWTKTWLSAAALATLLCPIFIVTNGLVPALTS